jgi:hypothetical protein
MQTLYFISWLVAYPVRFVVAVVLTLVLVIFSGFGDGDMVVEVPKLWRWCKYGNSDSKYLWKLRY